TAAATRTRIEALSVAAAAVPSAGSMPARRRHLDDLVARIDSSPRPGDGPERSVLLVVHGATDHSAVPASTSSRTLRVASADDDAEVAQMIAEAGEDLVGLIDASLEPLTADIWAVLADAIAGGAAAATGLLVHPQRPRSRATIYDLLVRSAGFDVEIDSDGAPHVLARAAGTGLDRRHGRDDRPSPVAAASGALLLVDRAALVDAGGYVATGDRDVSVLDLCLRMADRGRPIVCDPSAVAFDHRPVTRGTHLTRPIDESSPQWRRLLEERGPILRRSAVDHDPTSLDLVITVASPMRKVADRWGDWHLAEALARATTERGHHVHVQTLDEVASPRSRAADVHLVLRGLARIARTSGQAHVLWVISHPEDLDDEELDQADLVLVASEPFAEALRERTSTPVEVMLQATDAERFRPLAPDPAHRHDVTVVGRSRDVLRPMVADALAAGIRPAIYGSGWTDLVDPSLVVADHVDNHDLPRIYASAGVVLNDHWDTMRTWGFISNRVFDVLACGTPVVSDAVPGLTDLFGDLVATWSNPDDMAVAVGSALALDRSRFAERARSLVVDGHTFAHRAGELERALVRFGLVRPRR
ncbi:MAG: glycosyltransferase, partial [Acidimicrobiales bacterium]|nr:glycosyltransferase [Acidimicrobiales bacterium]